MFNVGNSYPRHNSSIETWQPSLIINDFFLYNPVMCKKKQQGEYLFNINEID
jgi:hypothetical protein